VSYIGDTNSICKTSDVGDTNDSINDIGDRNDKGDANVKSNTIMTPMLSLVWVTSRLPVTIMAPVTTTLLMPVIPVKSMTRKRQQDLFCQKASASG
jgi:hypothetical protein